MRCFFTKRLSYLSMLIPFFSVSTAHASYINSCELKGQIITQPAHYRLYVKNPEGLEIERIKTSFKFKVKQSKPSGRADSGCSPQIGKTIVVNLLDETEHLSLRKNQIIRINELHKNFEEAPAMMHDFTWIKPQK